VEQGQQVISGFFPERLLLKVIQTFIYGCALLVTLGFIADKFIAFAAVAAWPNPIRIHNNDVVAMGTCFSLGLEDLAFRHGH